MKVNHDTSPSVLAAAESSLDISPADQSEVSATKVSKSPRRPGNQARRPVLYSMIGLICLSALLGALWVFSNLVEITQFSKPEANKDKVATISDSEIEGTDTTQNVDEVAIRFKFPENLDAFNITQGQHVAGLGKINADQSVVRFDSSFALSTKEFVSIDPAKTYLGAAKFNFLYKLKPGEKPPILSIGFLNFDQNGVRLKAPENYTSFIFSGRLRADAITASREGYMTVSELISPSNSARGIEFPAGAAKFKPFISLKTESKEFVFELLALSMLEVEW